MRKNIVGEVAGGASCAARLPRLDEHADIVMAERGPYVSSANSGLPDHIGGVIEPLSHWGSDTDASLEPSAVRTSHSTAGRTS
jgi:NADPH-dependent 2,4-dienoyl-CoA reductase/sulfur reductase-like enzyme